MLSQVLGTEVKKSNTVVCIIGTGNLVLNLMFSLHMVS